MLAFSGALPASQASSSALAPLSSGPARSAGASPTPVPTRSAGAAPAPVPARSAGAAASPRTPKAPVEIVKPPHGSAKAEP